MTANGAQPLAAEIGRIVRGARIAIGWSQDDLSARSRVPQSEISRLERGCHSGIDFGGLERIGQRPDLLHEKFQRQQQLGANARMTQAG